MGGTRGDYLYFTPTAEFHRPRPTIKTPSGRQLEEFPMTGDIINFIASSGDYPAVVRNDAWSTQGETDIWKLSSHKKKITTKHSFQPVAVPQNTFCWEQWHRTDVKPGLCSLQNHWQMLWKTFPLVRNKRCSHSQIFHRHWFNWWACVGWIPYSKHFSFGCRLRYGQNR